MKNLISALIFLVIVSACQRKITADDINKINGYWEIEKVVLPNGNEKQYGLNMSYDFFEVKGNSGFRKKVMPQLDGSFLTNELSEQLKVSFENDTTWLNYTTPYSKWREKILDLSEEKMTILNAQKIEYHYKKAGPINLTGDGEKE